MTTPSDAREILNEAYEFLNGNPDNRVQEFLLAKEVVEEEDDGEVSRDLDVIELPLHKKIHTELNSVFVEELFRIRSSTNRNDGDLEITQYSASNINQEVTPIQYMKFNEIPNSEFYSPLTDLRSFRESSYEAFEDAAFQVLRVRDKWGNMFLGLRKFTTSQIVGSSWKIKLTLGDDEYDKFENSLFALPERFDAFVYKDHIFVKNQSAFEDIFNYFTQYETQTQEVLENLEECDIRIHNDSFFKNCVSNDRYALRNMSSVYQSDIYRELTPEIVEEEIEKYELNVETEEREGEWGIVLPSKGDKKDLIRILTDDNLLSESTERRYQSTGGKRQV